VREMQRTGAKVGGDEMGTQEQIVYRVREQDELWAVVSGAEFRGGAPSGSRKRKWEDMGWNGHGDLG
jgi:hypothetical protein